MFTRISDDRAQWADPGDALFPNSARVYDILQLNDTQWLVSGRLTDREHANRMPYLPTYVATVHVPGVLGYEIAVPATGEIVGYGLGLDDFGPVVKRYYVDEGLIK